MSQEPSSAGSVSPNTSHPGALVGSPRGTPNGSAHSRRTSQSAKKSGGRTLTAAQLEKKRANDREAQRAIRERTKHLIESLEKRIQELESGEAYKQLQVVIKEKEAVQAENAELRKRLSSILELIRPVFPHDSPLNEPTNGSSNHGYAAGSRESSSLPASSITASYSTAPSATGRSNAAPTQPSPAFGPVPTSGEGKSSLSSNVSSPWEHHRPDPWDRIVHPTPPHRQYEAPSSERQYNSLPSLSTPISTRSETSAGFSTPSNFVSNTNGSHPYSSQSYTQEKPSGPDHALLPLNLGPTCDFDKIVYDFTAAGKRQLAEGRPLDSICGGSRVTLTSLTDHRSSKHSDDHYLSDLLINLLKGFSLIKGLPEKIAVVNNMFEYMRWIIQPNEETFNAVPPYMRPVEEQLRIAHPIWVDYLPWPRMRLKLLYEYPWLPLETFFFPYCKTLAVDFPHRDVLGCLDHDPETDEMYIKPELYHIIRQLHHWSIGSEFASMFPVLADSCRIKDS